MAYGYGLWNGNLWVNLWVPLRPGLSTKFLAQGTLATYSLSLIKLVYLYDSLDRVVGCWLKLASSVLTPAVLSLQRHHIPVTSH